MPTARLGAEAEEAAINTSTGCNLVNTRQKVSENEHKGANFEVDGSCLYLTKVVRTTVATTKSEFKVAWDAYKLMHPEVFACTLRASGTTAYDLKTDAHSLGTSKYSAMMDAHSLRTSKYSLGTSKYSAGTDMRTPSGRPSAPSGRRSAPEASRSSLANARGALSPPSCPLHA